LRRGCTSIIDGIVGINIIFYVLILLNIFVNLGFRKKSRLKNTSLLYASIFAKLLLHLTHFVIGNTST